MMFTIKCYQGQPQGECLKLKLRCSTFSSRLSSCFCIQINGRRFFFFTIWYMPRSIETSVDQRLQVLNVQVSVGYGFIRSNSCWPRLNLYNAKEMKPKCRQSKKMMKPFVGETVQSNNTD